MNICNNIEYLDANIHGLINNINTKAKCHHL